MLLGRDESGTFESAASQSSRVRLSDLPTRLLESPHTNLYCYDHGGAIRRISYERIYQDVHELVEDLKACGVEPRCAVGLAGPNDYAWVVCDLALIALDCVSVCFTEASLKDATFEQLGSRYNLHAMLLTSTRHTSVRYPHWVGIYGAGPLRLVRRALETERQFPSDVFSLSFSSGTTGTTKCLMMSKNGIEQTVSISGHAWRVTPSDNILVVLPFSNMQQRTMVYIALWFGFSVSVVTPERMFRALSEMSPTIVIGPPAFFEGLEREVWANPVSRALLRAFIATWPSPVASRLLSFLLRNTLLYRYKARWRRSTRLLLVGSAPVRKTTLQLYRCLNIPLYEVYGLTEFGWIAFNLPKVSRVGSAGKPLRHIQLSFKPDGEIIVHSQFSQSLGYVYDGENEMGIYTAQGITTGDIGHLDPDGYLYLVGRKKNVLVTRSGCKLNPEVIEARVECIERVTRAAVLQDDTALVCIVWLPRERFQEDKELVSAEIRVVNTRSAISERIDRLVFREAVELTEETGLLTRNCKLNRSVLSERYRLGWPK